MSVVAFLFQNFKNVAMLNYLFYWLSRMKFYEPIYSAKIFTPVIVVATFMPASLTLSKYFFGCYDIKANDLTVKIILSIIVLLVMTVTNFYYTPNRVEKLLDKYSGEPKLQRNLKLFLICVLLMAIFWYGSALLRMLIDIPECG